MSARLARATVLFARASLLTIALGCSPAPAPPPPAAQGAGGALAGATSATAGGARTPAGVPADTVATYAALRGDGESPQTGGRILRHLESDLKTLNPVLQSQIYELYVLLYLFDPLLAYNQKLELVPVLAERWETAADGRSTTMWLRRDVRWHDGKPLVPADVCFSADMAIHPLSGAINVKGALSELAGCDALDGNAVRFRWRRPFTAGLAALTSLLPLPEHVYGVKDPAAFARLPANRAPIGNGPWRFVSWESQSRIVLHRNDDYWGTKPHPDEIVFKVIDNRETALKACEAGELDEQYVPQQKWATDVQGPGFADFEKVLYYMLQFNQVALNNKSWQFSDKRVRQAMAMSYDSAGIVRELYGGLARRISGPFAPDSEWSDPTVAPWPYDLARAAALLEEAGWKDRDGDGLRDRDGRAFEFELLYPSGSTISEQTGAVFQQALTQLGVRMTLRALEGATFFERVDKGDFTASTLAWSGDPDPESMLVLFDSRQQPPNGVNHVHYSNPEVDRLIDQQREEFDHAKRVEIVRAIHRILREEVPTIFAIGRPEARIFRKNLRGIHMSNYGPFQVRPGAQEWWLRAAGTEGRGTAVAR